MCRLLIGIKDNRKMDALLKFLKSLDYIGVEEVSDKDIIV